MNESINWASTTPDLRWRRAGESGDGNDNHRRRGAPESTYTTNRGFYEENYGDAQADNNKRGGMFSFSYLLKMYRWCKYNCSAALICAAGVASSILSATVVATPLIQIASTLSILLSILVLWQRKKIRRLGTLRQQNNELRGHANYFKQERERLHRTLSRLDETCAELHSVPHELHRLTKNKNLDRVLEVIQEQELIQEQMRDAINKQIMQDILEVVMRVDRDKDWTLRPTEIETLIVRLGLNPMVEVNETKFRQMLLMAPNVSTIMQLIRALLERDDEYEHSDSVLKIKLDNFPSQQGNQSKSNEGPTEFD